MNNRKENFKRRFITAALSALIVVFSVHPCFASIIDNHGTYKYATVTDLLGITRSDIVQWLSSHENDDYYLGTPYCYRTGDIINGIAVPENFDIHGTKWGIWPYGNAVFPYVYSPNGEIVSGGVAQMNCGGFVHHVLTHASNKNGTEDQGIRDRISYLERMYDTSGMGFAGACSFFLAMQGAGVRFYVYDTIKAVLDSGILEKGDIILIDGIGSYGMIPDRFNNTRDWHIGFFWGDSPDENVFWHSFHEAFGEKTITAGNGIVLTNPAYIKDPAYTDQFVKGPLNDPAKKEDHTLYGNVISRIIPPSEYDGVVVFKFSGDYPRKQADIDNNYSYLIGSCFYQGRLKKSLCMQVRLNLNTISFLKRKLDCCR